MIVMWQIHGGNCLVVPFAYIGNPRSLLSLLVEVLQAKDSLGI
jgi:hypothetical protein